MKYDWTLKCQENETFSSFAQELGIPDYLAKLLVLRNIDTREKVELFFNGTVDNLRDPFRFNGMDQAIDRIQMAIQNKERILIYGDYDVDGVTSIVLIKKALEELGGIVKYALPNRFQDGYGLKTTKLDSVHAKYPFSLVITVDCGIKARDEIRELTEKGIDVIVTDHHEPDENLPENVVAIINPKVQNSGFEDEPLAGVGVAFKVAEALNIRMNNALNMDYLIKIVSIGTVADLVPLLGENRILVREGLKRIRKSRTAGLETMIDFCNINKSTIESVDISYKIAPRINALGRLGDATSAIELFLSESKSEIKEHAEYMNRKNQERQRLEKTLDSMVQDQVKNNQDNSTRFMLLSGEYWHKGVIGIVASKMQKKYYRPVGIVSIEDGMAYGSIRSIDGVNIIEVLDTFSHLLESHGGHKQAAGITLKEKNLPILKAEINRHLNEHYNEELFVPKIEIDYVLDFSLIDDTFYKNIKKLEPFGIRNPQPVFLTRDIIIESEAELINNRHLKFKVGNGLIQFVVIGYNKSHLYDQIQKFDSADIVYTLEKNRWNRKTYFQLNLIDIKTR